MPMSSVAKRKVPPSSSAQDEADADEPCSSSSPNKRARYSSASAEQVPRFRSTQQVLRPGVPHPIDLADFKLADKPSPPLREDDKEGHYNYELGENISSRYKILSKFGEGTFGRVLECWDRKVKDYCAVKIVRNVDKYRHAAMIELEVLNTLERNDPGSKRHCVKLKEWFNYRGHVCMVFEKLGPSLYDYLRRNEYQPLPLALVQAIARQLLQAVAYIHELGLVHTDLKPENILMAAQEHMKLQPVPPANVDRRVPVDSRIRVIDFGSATFDDGYHSNVISTRHYRAPEVILGLGWSYPCDMWSCGCILVELAVGDALFQTHENLEHLAMMQRVLGPIPVGMSSRADKGAAKFFTSSGSGSGSGSAAAQQPRLAWPDSHTTNKSKAAVNRLQELRTLLVQRSDKEVDGGAHAVEALADLIEGLLRYDPAHRIRAAEALQHEFFTLQLDLPTGVGNSPEPGTAAAAAAAAGAGAGGMVAAGGTTAAAAAGAAAEVAGGRKRTRQQADAAAAADQQALLQQQGLVQTLQPPLMLQHQQQQPHQLQQGAPRQRQQRLRPLPTGVSGDVAAEAVAAHAARQAAAAAAGSGGHSGGGSGGGAGASSSAAAAAAGGLHKVFPGMHGALTADAAEAVTAGMQGVLQHQ